MTQKIILRMLEWEIWAVHGLFKIVEQIWEAVISTYRGGSSAAATSKMECFVIIVNGWKPLTIITKCSILDVAAVLDPSLTYA